ncbi:MAG: hypothetical protein HY517_03975 [Candidatus Aenigmarchaeota archaeon]|nr:hypothetical protein [Candidatus Aenigmarchaeota archaeon]
MEISLSQKLSFPVKSVVSSVDINQIENFSHFSAVRLAKKSFERLGFFVAEGADFEENFLFYFFEKERLFCDEYTKVKLGKSLMTPEKEEFCRTLLEVMPEADVRLLLVLCRFCSYAGAPGFPDLIMMKGGKWSSCYVLFDELSESQKLFLMMSRMIGMEPRITKLANEESEDTMQIDPFAVIDSILSDRRSISIMEGLEENIAESEKNADSSSGREKEIWEDEFAYLNDEKAKNSLFLLKKWKNQGFASEPSLKGAVRFAMTHQRHDFEKFLLQLQSDQDFGSIKQLKTEEGMKAKAEFMQKKFGIGRTRSKLLLNFF